MIQNDRLSLTELLFDEQDDLDAIEAKSTELCIEFATWIHNNWLTPDHSGFWCFDLDNIEFKVPFKDCKADSIFSEEELFKKFNNKEGEF